METVLVIGGTGNIGTSAVKASLNSGRKVLAVVRNQKSADKLIQNIGSAEGITFTEADVCSDTGVHGVVDQVRAGKLPAFQHVYSCVGGGYETTSLQDITTSYLRSEMNSSFESNLFAYQATISYLLEQKTNDCTWTLCTGGMGHIAIRPMPAMTQGALFSFATAACVENAKTNVRFNEVCLWFRVEVDAQAEENGAVKATSFAKVYEGILADRSIRGSRVTVNYVHAMINLNHKSKIMSFADIGKL
ncbi:Hypothetical protein R9X50_00513100 [Acrodontium crateriforme]|uniref:Uncharacterized protein n=1 Tax=Acrodontium crateriforme TaxID=150365 RepID=A0AAQ3M6K6_9PEZI|nr:Hypothetical protein R9X50_00513100 [Acrodontium crateriforme]